MPTWCSPALPSGLCRPVITINKLDRAFLELQLPSDDMYTAFVKHVENVNVLVSTYHDEALGDVQVDPTKGTVAFSAGLHGWAFTLTKFARMYAKKFGVDIEKMMQRLWGDNFFNPKEKKWIKTTGAVHCRTLTPVPTLTPSPIRPLLTLALTLARCPHVLRRHQARRPRACLLHVLPHAHRQGLH